MRKYGDYDIVPINLEESASDVVRHLISDLDIVYGEGAIRFVVKTQWGDEDLGTLSDPTFITFLEAGGHDGDILDQMFWGSKVNCDEEYNVKVFMICMAETDKPSAIANSEVGTSLVKTSKETGES